MAEQKKVVKEMTQITEGGFKSKFTFYDDNSIDAKPLQRYFLVGYQGVKHIGNSILQNNGILGMDATRMMSINEIKNHIHSIQALDPSYKYTIVSFTEVEENDYKVIFRK